MKTIRRNLEDVWWEIYYGVRARVDAICHKLRHPSHRLLWRANGCCIDCYTCNHVFWCRSNQWNNFIGRWLCSILGHDWSDGLGWKLYIGWDDIKQEEKWEPLGPQRPHCERCFAQKPDWIEPSNS
jgi:hypothetical protein